MVKRNLKKLLSELNILFPEIETRDSGSNFVHIDGNVVIETACPSADYHNSVGLVLAYLLGKGETEISLDSCSPKDYHLLFQFESVIYMGNWPPEFAHRVKSKYYAAGQFPKVCELKINNIRWIMDPKTIARLTGIFPRLEKVEYVDNEDDGVLEAETYGVSKEDARSSAKEVDDILGGIGVPFAW